MSKNDMFKVNENTQIIYQCTSFGRLYPKLVTEFIMNIMGGKINFNDVLQKQRLKYIFPESEQVLATHLGSNTNCLKLREDFWFDNKDFPRYLFHKFDYKDTCEKYTKNVHHSKVMIIKEKDKEIDDNTAIYLGSHNMSGGAWGVLQRAGKTFFIGNYELGVMFKPKEGTKEMKQRIVDSLLYTIDPQVYDLQTEKPFLFVKVF